ncbi:hypothetical protein K438DRAFT_1937710 [Mycena galopus ATCC 62051]|nr:hypothetical protein K438DRAFT_1937710 [Mycena galopus ATCC 62051]
MGYGVAGGRGWLGHRAHHGRGSRRIMKPRDRRGGNAEWGKRHRFHFRPTCSSSGFETQMNGIGVTSLKLVRNRCGAKLAKMIYNGEAAKAARSEPPRAWESADLIVPILTSGTPASLSSSPVLPSVVGQVSGPFGSGEARDGSRTRMSWMYVAGSSTALSRVSVPFPSAGPTCKVSTRRGSGTWGEVRAEVVSARMARTPRAPSARATGIAKLGTGPLLGAVSWCGIARRGGRAESVFGGEESHVVTDGAVPNEARHVAEGRRVSGRVCYWVLAGGGGDAGHGDSV